MKKIHYNKLAPFRFRKINEKYLLTNDVGDYIFLKQADFELYLQNKIDKKSEVYKVLKDKNFISDEVKLDAFIDRYRDRKKFITSGGPSLHILVVTQKCNHNCLYCHASAKNQSEKGLDMSKETADRALDIIFETTNQKVAIEFQGGEPLLNWETVEYAIREAEARNKKYKKDLEFRFVTNFSVMDDKKLKFLKDRKVGICTSLDGDKNLHNKNRPLKGFESHKIVSAWIHKLKKAKTVNLSAIPTVSKHSLGAHKRIVDEYLSHGFSTIFLRPLNPFGIKKEDWEKIGYSAREYIKFYTKALDYIIDLNKQGKKIVERSVSFYLQKILTDNDPNYLESRSPCGAGIGQLAYNYNGDVYTCDEGRMMSMIGDESFKIGNVYKSTYENIVMHTATKTLCTASCLENLAGCSDCAYLPYCGVCPIYNYFEQGNIYAQMARSERCKISMATLDYLILKMEDEENKKIFNNWLE